MISPPQNLFAGQVAVGTVASRRRLSWVRALASSLQTVHPGAELHVLVTDGDDAPVQRDGNHFETLTLHDVAPELGPDELALLRFRLDEQALAVSAKPPLLRHLLDRGFGRALFLDADTLVLGSLAPLFGALVGPAVLLVPHHLEPLTGPGRAERELRALCSGAFNAGVVGVSDQPEARRFLAWWSERTRQHCRHDLDVGVYYDQRWIDLAPSLFDSVGVMRDAGVDVAYWNLQERALGLRDGGLVAAGEPLRLFHFSGFDPGRPELASEHPPRPAVDAWGPLAAGLFENYAAQLREAGWPASTRRPYGWSCFTDGTPIPAEARRMHRELGEQAAEFGDPFQVDDRNSFFAWLRSPPPDDEDTTRSIPRLWRSIYRRRSDLQHAFPNLLSADRDAFLAWTRTSGLEEHRVHPTLLPPSARA